MIHTEISCFRDDIARALSPSKLAVRANDCADDRACSDYVCVFSGGAWTRYARWQNLSILAALVLSRKKITEALLSLNPTGGSFLANKFSYRLQAIQPAPLIR